MNLVEKVKLLIAGAVLVSGPLSGAKIGCYIADKQNASLKPEYRNIAAARYFYGTTGVCIGLAFSLAGVVLMYSKIEENEKEDKEDNSYKGTAWRP